MIEYTSRNCQVIFIDDIPTVSQITSRDVVLLTAACEFQAAGAANENLCSPSFRCFLAERSHKQEEMLAVVVTGSARKEGLCPERT